MNKITEIKAIFFDFDGTLTDISKREVYAIHHTVNHFGLTVSTVQVKQLLNNIMLVSICYTDIYKALGLTLTDEVVEYWTSAFNKRHRLSILRKGTRDTLKNLSRKYEILCVTSRETLAEVELELEYLELEKLFDYIVTREVAADYFRLQSIPFLPFHVQRKKLYECALEMLD